MGMFQGNSNSFNFICGMAGSGKTYFALKELERDYSPAFFFNPQETETNFCRVDGSYKVSDIIRALKKGEKLNYIPRQSLKKAKYEINTIIQEIFAADCMREKPFNFAIDEVHLVAKQGDNNEYINMIPTRGRVFGFRGIFIAQRPALVDKTIVTQCTKHFIFHTEWETAYFKTKGLDPEKINSLLGDFRKSPHNYVIYESGQITGPYLEGK
jgi:hypothetical protein